MRLCIVLVGMASLAASLNAQPSALDPPQTAPRAAIQPPALNADTPSEYPGLHNVVAYAKDFYSGSAPEGAAGFESLRAMGIKTIISVDGAAPEVAAAKAVGLKYIHLPIGYNGMDKERTLEIAKAVKLSIATGPVYLHCHHGKHRSAGAAGAAAVTLGLLDTEQATAKLHVSGTAANYTGLYKCVSVAQIASAAELEAVPGDFPETSGPTGLVESMVEVDDIMEHLKAIETAAWSTPKEHPDLVPVAEAGRLADLFRIAGETDKAKARTAEFREWLGAASQTATQIEDQLAAGGKGGAADAKELSAKFRALNQSCKDCHAKYRD